MRTSSRQAVILNYTYYHYKLPNECSIFNAENLAILCNVCVIIYIYIYIFPTKIYNIFTESFSFINCFKTKLITISYLTMLLQKTIT